MNIFTIATLVAFLILLFALGLMWLIVNFSQLVVNNEAAIEAKEKSRNAVNPSQTGGLAISASADYKQQLFDARRLAAKIAAHKKRGENLTIGRLGTTDAHKDKKHVTVGVKTDPLSAVKIAHFHTWKGLDIAKTAVAAGPGAAPSGAVKTVKRKLVAGKDFQWVDFKGLSGGAKRKAIIANGKAKYAAYKAAKAAGLDTMTVAAGGAAPAAQAVAAAPAIELPPAPTLTKIVAGMDPAAKRKAMIGNSKAKSAYNKQLKAIGINPKDVKWTDEGPKLPDSAQAALSAAQAAAPAPVAAGASATPTASIELPPAPEFTVITADMDPAAKRKAMIGNSKAKSAYNKQLKAAGIDPKTVKWTDAGPVLKQATAPATPVAATAPTATVDADVPPPPTMVEIVDGMDPAAKRAAMIANSKAKSAYKKQLKAMGIDPKSVKI